MAPMFFVGLSTGIFVGYVMGVRFADRARIDLLGDINELTRRH